MENFGAINVVNRFTLHFCKYKMVYIYTDGACSGNPGPGGYGAILTYNGKEKILSGGFRLTTNNRMELLACIVALEALKKPGLPVTIVSDSRYVCDAISKGWLYAWLKKGFKGKKNPDLWKRFYPLLQKHQITMKWIKGHAGHPMNERCDHLAVAASQTRNLPADEVFEKSGDDIAAIF